MNDEALLPCPFCSDEGLIGPIRDGAAVCCRNLKCLGQVQAFNPNARAKAVAAWNTRALSSPPNVGEGTEDGRSPSGRAATPSGPSPAVSGIAGIPNAAWQPIETAPKDERILLLYRTAIDLRVEIGRWDDDRFASRPRPYWSSTAERLWGVTAARKNPPTHWQPLPAPPALKETPA